MERRGRSSAPELMDDPRIDPAELRAALAELRTINRWLGGFAPSLGGLAALVPRGVESLTILDAGTGSGDVARRIVEWCRRRRIAVAVTAIDISSDAIGAARELSPRHPEIEWRRADLLDPGFAGSWDVAHSSLALHHFAGDEAARALRRLRELARTGIVINDLHRHALAHASIRALTSVLSRNRLIRHDAPLSVLRGFTRAEWDDLGRAAGLGSPEVRWRWAFRWQVVWRLGRGIDTIPPGNRAP